MDSPTCLIIADVGYKTLSLVLTLGVVTNAAVPVADGLFTVTLNFGPAVFDGSDRWLEIGAVTNGGGTVSAGNPKTFLITANAVGIGTIAPTHLLHVNGVARSTQSTWATSSDRRAKRDIATLEGSLERVSRLRPVTFEYTPDYADGRQGYEGRFTGFIAQEVGPVFPEMVETVRERIGDNEVGDFRLLNTGSLTPHLVSEIQELNEKLAQELNRRDAENSELKRNNASLEQRLAALEQIIGSQNQN